MLSTIHRMSSSHVIHAPVELYKECFHNHPCTIWARQTSENYCWLADHTLELSREYTFRYSRIHKSHDMCKWFSLNIPWNVPFGARTEFAQAMPDKYKDQSSIVAYRRYYVNEKMKFAKWKYSEKPEWIDDENLKVNDVPMQVLQS